MSYCGPKWFSDYNYRKLYDDQRAHGALIVATQVPSLLIRGVLDAAGGASLQPIYSLPVTPSETPLSSDYSVELLDSEGELLLSQAVLLSYAEEEGIVSRAIYANVALPDERVAAVRLLKAGTPVAERLLRSFAAVAAAPSISQTPHELILSWSAPGVPALVRYTTDDGQSWTTVGLDVLDNELRLDPQTLTGSTGWFEITFADANTVTPFRGLFYGDSTIRPESAD